MEQRPYRLNIGHQMRIACRADDQIDSVWLTRLHPPRRRMSMIETVGSGSQRLPRTVGFVGSRAIEEVRHGDQYANDNPRLDGVKYGPAAICLSVINIVATI